MELDELCKDINHWCQSHGNIIITIILICELLTLVVGILGNLVNILVFGHKNMAHQPINSIFWWLSMSDLLELTILIIYQRSIGWWGTFTLTLGDFTSRTRYSIDVCRLINVYLFLVVHAVTIGFNIALVFCQYMVVAYPLMNHKNFLNDRSIKLTVICMYISSFVLHLPFWYIYKMYDEGELEGTYGVRCFEDPSTYTLTYICIVFYGMVLRIGPLIILIILCTLLLFAIKNSQRDRQRLGMEARHLSKAQRNLNRMNVTIIVVVLMFFITEVPIGMESFFLISSNINCQSLLNRTVLFPFILLNCSYSIFCYLLRIKQYRETLKLLLSKSNWVRSRVCVAEQTDLELQPH